MPKAKTLAISAALALIFAMPATAQPQLTIDALMSPAAHGRYPSAPAWRPGQAQLSYWWDDGSGDAFWLHDAASG
ncbi:MAG: hypothetical protein HC897_19565, partial [Thermoanaerobaculia bacterium]|nr:hypothetical protein [Thermoanaerobaculia bacterium]